MTEQAYRFGRAQHLIGIIGSPPLGMGNGKLGIIVLNAGLVQRIGPFRLHVDLTRRLNNSGYPTLRLDLSTLGDSAATGEAQSRAQQVRADVADGMTLLGQQAGCARFVLIGLCSGAANAHLVACGEARVAGVVFLDGFAYRTLGFVLRRYLPKLANPLRIWRFFTRRLQPAKQAVVEPNFGVAVPPREQVRNELAGMLERGIKLCFIYSGGASEYFNHRRQFRECFGSVASHRGISISYLKEADHTYILAPDRQLLLNTIEDWLVRTLPPTITVTV
ncbi:MAG: alpha/beta fold hydrolase [Rhodanobacter sp.]